MKGIEHFCKENPTSSLAHQSSRIYFVAHAILVSGLVYQSSLFLALENRYEPAHGPKSPTYLKVIQSHFCRHPINLTIINFYPPFPHFPPKILHGIKNTDMYRHHGWQTIGGRVDYTFSSGEILSVICENL